MTLDRTVQFDSTASRPKRGVALIYDLQGFSRFFNQPDAQEYVPKFLNLVSKAISVLIFGGKQFWLSSNTAKREIGPLSAPPVHEKFLGDGALYIWAESSKHRLTHSFSTDLCNRVWNFKNQFPQLLRYAAGQLPVLELPPAIRFGVAGGTVFEMARARTRQKEYIGVCLNLASRLQKYCPDLNFIASARVGFTDRGANAHGYIRVVANEIRGFPKEIVVVDSDEFNALPEKTRDQYFSKIE